MAWLHGNTEPERSASELLSSGNSIKKIRKPKKAKATAQQQPELPKKPPFTPEMIKAGLSQLGKTADGLRPAFLRLDISHGTDMATTQELSGFPDLQVVVLPNNELKNLSNLSLLPNLIHLDVSNNKLTDVLNFKFLEGSRSNLRYADFAGNRITTLPDLSAFSRLTTLALDRNEIEVLHGLHGLSVLNTLSLADNKLRSIEGLEALYSLRHLKLKGNRLRSLRPLRPLAGLQTLNASLNQLTSLEGAEGLVDLQQLDVTHNALPGLSVTGPCAKLAFLDRLDIMRGNPLAKIMGCRLHLVHLLPQVAVLDGVAVASNEKVHAANMHGAAAEGLLAIRKKYFPRGELDDNGGTLPPPSAGLVASGATEEATDPSGVQSAFLRIDACLQGINVSPTHIQGATAMLETIAAHTAEAAAATAAAAAGPTATPTTAHSCSRMSSMQPAQTPPNSDHAASASGLSSPVQQPQQESPNDQHPQPGLDAEPSGISAGGGVNPRPSSTSALAGSVSVPPNGPALLALATELASVCQGQLQLARACYQWVATHTDAPEGPGATSSVDAPLFATEAQELLLLGYGDAAITGTWAERAAWLFVQLSRACELEAVLIAGFWKGDRTICPGRPIAAHNHCWAGVKVNGQWRLLDPTLASLNKGRDTPSAPFFVPPMAFIYAYFPLEDHWQLLPEPMPLARWWSLPQVSVSFLARGMVLLEALELGHLRSINILPAPREGQVLPVLQIRLAAPNVRNCFLRHSLRDIATGQLVYAQLGSTGSKKQEQQQGSKEGEQTQGSGHVQGHGRGERFGGMGRQGATASNGPTAVLWPPPLCGSTGSARAAEFKAAAQGALAFQQVEQVSVDSSPASHMVRFGANSFLCSPYSLVVCPPGPGEYELVVEHITELPGSMPVQLEGMASPLKLRLEEVEEVLSIMVVVPNTVPHDPEAGILHDATTQPCLLPYTHLEFIKRRVQLVSPCVTQQLQADRVYKFQVVVPGAKQVALLLPNGAVLQHLSLPEPLVPTQHQPSTAGAPHNSSSSCSNPPQLPHSLTPSRSIMGPHGTLRMHGRGQHPERWCSDVEAPRVPFIRLAMTEQLNVAATVDEVKGAADHTAAAAAEQTEQGLTAEEGLDSPLSSSGIHWVPLLTFHVCEQLQHMIDSGIEPEVPLIESDQPSARVAVEMFRKMDLDQDGKVSRKDMLAAVRKDPEVACSLGLPRHISLADGSMDMFNETFLSIDTSGLGTFNFSELCRRLGIKPESSFGRVTSQVQEQDSSDEDEEDELSYSQ